MPCACRIMSRPNGYVVGSSRIEFLCWLQKAFTSHTNLFKGSPHFQSCEKYLMYHEMVVLTYCVAADFRQPLKGLISLMFIMFCKWKGFLKCIQ